MWCDCGPSRKSGPDENESDGGDVTSGSWLHLSLFIDTRHTVRHEAGSCHYSVTQNTLLDTRLLPAIQWHTTHCQTRGCFLPLFSDTGHTVRHEAWHTVRLAWSRRRTQGVKGHGSWSGSRVMRLKVRLGVQESNVKSAYGHCRRTVAYT